MSSLYLLTILILLLININYNISTNLCICECCEKSICVPTINTTIIINSCNLCTSTYCSNYFTSCTNSNIIDVNSKCVNRDAWWNKISIVSFLTIIFTLLIIGLLKDYVPFIEKIVQDTQEF